MNCKQIGSLCENANVEESIWYAGIGVAAGCDNSSEAAKELSINYDNYNELEVVKKLRQYQSATTGPTLCSRFMELRPEECSGCPHARKITTPVQLGKITTSNNPFVDFDKVIESNIQLVTPESKQPIEENTFALPEAKQISEDNEQMFIPSPYFLGKDGSLLCEVENEAIEISPHPIYVSQIAMLYHNRSPMSFATLRYKLPYKRWGNLEIEVANLTSSGSKGDTVGAKLMNAGFYLDMKNLKKIQEYIVHSLNARQAIEAPDQIVTNYGWTEHGSFILGNVEYTANENIVGVAKNKTLVEFGSIYESKGDLDQWVKLSKAFLLPDTEYHAFTMFLGLGAPLMKMTNIGGSVVNLQSEDTGIGKSTCGMWGLSLYGNPSTSKNEAKDTQVSLFLKLGLINNIPMYIDDISTWSGEDISDFLYSASTGQEKSRGTRDAELRERNQWNTIVVTSSNPSLNDALDNHTQVTQGQKSRLLEIPFNKNPKFIEIAGSIVLALSQNYGLAGPIYIKELVKRHSLGELSPMLQTAREQYQAQFNFYFLDEERFIFTTIGAAWVGAKISQEIGLIDRNIDLPRIFAKINTLVLKNRKVNVMVKECATDAINQFVVQHHKNFVKVKRFTYGSKTPEGTCPNEGLFGRIELLYGSKGSMKAEKGYVTVSTEEFKRFCKNTGRAYIRYETELGVMTSFKKHRANLAAGVSLTLSGSPAPQLPIACMSFELPSDLLDVYNITEESNQFNNTEPY